MSERNINKKLTVEDKFDRKYWVSNKAKKLWIRWTKRRNNKLVRKYFKKQIEKENIKL